MIKIYGNKLWIKIILEKKRRKITKLIETVTSLGLELIDINVSTSKGAMLVSSCVEVTIVRTQNLTANNSNATLIVLCLNSLIFFFLFFFLNQMNVLWFQDSYGGTRTVEQTKELLLEIIGSI